MNANPRRRAGPAEVALEPPPPGPLVRRRVGLGALLVILAAGAIGAAIWHRVADTMASGEDTVLHPGVVVYHECNIGERCILHAGTVIGADGFGFARESHGWSKIAQLGRVVIGDDVEIGANCTIDRGAIEDTEIGRGCKLDNQIQVGHNVRIGEHTAIAGCVGIAGSATIGRGCMIGGGAGILGHLQVCDGAVISAMTLVTRSITQPGLHTGVFPLMPNAQWERAAATLKQLPELRERLRRLEQSPAAKPEQPDSLGVRRSDTGDSS